MTKAKYSHGFVLGKFMPLHVGHIYLIETAQEQSKKLTILLCSQPDDPIPGKLRLEWLKQKFPKADIVHHSKALPRDQTKEGFWDLWRESILEYTGERKFDAVFSSEDYGERLASELGAQHVAVDLGRKKFPISATEIRKNPKAHQRFIPDNVRPYYKDRLRKT